MAKVNFSITSTLKGTLPRVPFQKIKESILSTSYELSLVLIADTFARTLNKKHKNKNTPTNVLSFPLTKMEGEIFINLRRAKRDAPKFGHTFREHVAFLFIHGCLHLKGETHGKEMEKKEDILLERLKLS